MQIYIFFCIIAQFFRIFAISKNNRGWYIFEPNNFTKTLAEMDEQERQDRRAVDGSSSALIEFTKWYKANK